MDVSKLNLLIHRSSQDPDERLITGAWEAAGGTVTSIAKFWEPPLVERSTARIWGSNPFAIVLSLQLRVRLITPTEDLLVRLPLDCVRRKVELRMISDAHSLSYPRFIKAAEPKLFASAIYGNHHAFLEETKGLDSDAPIIVSDIVTFSSEARMFVLDGRVQDIAVYRGRANEGDMTAFGEIVAQSAFIPETCVIDIGLVPGAGWAVIEAKSRMGCQA